MHPFMEDGGRSYTYPGIRPPPLDSSSYDSSTPSPNLNNRTGGVHDKVKSVYGKVKGVHDKVGGGSAPVCVVVMITVSHTTGLHSA